MQARESHARGRDLSNVDETNPYSTQLSEVEKESLDHLRATINNQQSTNLLGFASSALSHHTSITLLH